jgi:membrane associated rhomboid family serine protease
MNKNKLIRFIIDVVARPIVAAFAIYIILLFFVSIGLLCSGIEINAAIFGLLFFFVLSLYI